MKNIRLKLLLLVIVMFSCTFFLSIEKTKAIYRETKSTTISLNVTNSSNYVVDFVSNGGTSVPSRSVAPNSAVGTLPIPTRTGYNFAGWYDANDNRVRHSTTITANTTLYAAWTEIVCKRVINNNDLHTESCASDGGCITAGFSAGNTITYGTVGDGVPESGDAYNCDVNYDGNFETKESDNVTFDERFYFVRTKINSGDEDSAVMYYSTSFDANGRNNRTQGKNDIGSYAYSTALDHLPSASLWDNTGLLDLDGNGAISRNPTLADVEAVCGTAVIKQTSYFRTCAKWFWFENTRFQSDQLGRSGIWLQEENGTYYRIQVHSFYLEIPTGGADSANMTRPIIEVKMSALEGYYDENRFTIGFDTYQNDPNPLQGVKRYRGEAIGTLPTPTREHYVFENWYTDSQHQNLVDPTALVEGNMTLYANWTAAPTVSVTLNLNGGSITGVTSPVSVDVGDLLDNLPDPTRPHHAFAGWYTDAGLNTPFDDTVPITANMALYAKWIVTSTFTVNLYLDNGTIPDVTSPMTVNYNDDLSTLPDPTKSGYVFRGWYTDSTFDTPFDKTQPVVTDLDLYARWLSDTCVAEVNQQCYNSLDTAVAAVPTTGVKTTVYLLKDTTLTVQVTIASTQWAEIDGGNHTVTGKGSTVVFSNSGKLDIISGTYIAKNAYLINNANNSTLNVSGGTLTTNGTRTIFNGSGVSVTISGGSFSNTSGTDTSNNVIEVGNSTVSITGGTFTNTSQGAVLNNRNGGTLNVSGGEIYATNTIKGQAIYMETNSSKTNISGNVYIENVSGDANNLRAAVDNTAGELVITGGTIVSKGYTAVINRGANAKTTIGTNDNNVDITSPVMRGYTYGLERTNGQVKVYDGIFESETNTTAFTGTIADKPNYNWTDTTIMIGTDTYYATYLLVPTFAVEFYPENGDSTITKTINNGSTIGSDMPSDPTKSGYYFDGWYDTNDVQVTSSTTVTSAIEAHARWVQSVSNATISPNPMTIGVNRTSQITFAENDIENVTYTSSDPSVATVSASGVVTGVSAGTATITLTGANSTDTETVSVTVKLYHTVTIDQNNGNPTTTIDVENGTQIGLLMPGTPTNTGYYFDGWYDGNNTLVTSGTTVNSPMTITAKWVQSVSNATITPSPMTIGEGDTEQITFAQNDIENVIYTSSDTSVATVSSTGLVTGISAGTATITLTGAKSTDTETVSVTVKEYFTVTFDKQDGSQAESFTVLDGGTLGTDMPGNLAKTNYIFEGWYVNGNSLLPITSSTTIDDDYTVYPIWKENILIATITPNPMIITLPNTQQITIAPSVNNELVENVTYSSGNTSVVTVSASGLVTSVGRGTTTITITGSESTETATISVTVKEYHNVTFDEANGNSTYTRSVEHGTTIGAQMPSNPTKSGYVFDKWVIENTSTAVDSTTTVNQAMNVVALWKENIQTATVTTPSTPMIVVIGYDEQISVTATNSGDTVEAVTYTSSDTNVATVDSTGLVHGEGVGTANITITGSGSNLTRTVSVSVTTPPLSNEVTFDPDNGDTATTVYVTTGDTIENYIPSTKPTKSGFVFDDWYLVENNTLTNTEISPSDTILANREYRAKWAPSGTVCKIKNVDYYQTVQAAANYIKNNGSTDPITIYMLADTSTSSGNDNTSFIDLTDNNFVGKNIIFDLQNHSISYTGNRKVYAIRSLANIEIKNGEVQSSANGAATVEIAPGGKLVMNSGSIKATNNRQAIYNDGGWVEIGGTTRLEAKTSGYVNGSNIYRGTISNLNNGTLIITGGTIINTQASGPAVAVNNGTVIIGEEDGTIDTTTPILQGENYGLYIKSGITADITVYDGIFKGKTAGISDTSIINHPDGTEFDTDDPENTYHLAYLYNIAATPTPEPTATPTPEPTATPTPEPTTILCKPVESASSLHKEQCQTADMSQGCGHSGYQTDEWITYGSVVTSNNYSAGNAFDCDVNGDEAFNSTTERFYYLRTVDNKAVLISSTNFEGSSGQLISDNYVYNTALTMLPTTSQWSAVATTYTHSGDNTEYAARFVTLADLRAATNLQNLETDKSLDGVRFLFENTTYALPTASGAHSTVWIEEDNGTRYRYHKNGVEVVAIASNQANSSANCVRPVIEVPLTRIDSVTTPTPTPTPTTYTVTFESVGGTISPSSATVTGGNAITNNDLPSTTTWGAKTFSGWYTDKEFTNQVVPGTTTVTGNVTYYAKWVYTPSSQKATYNASSDAIATYFSNISTWKDLAESTFQTTMKNNFDNYSCSSCNAENNCNNPDTNKTYCDKPKSYNTSAGGAVKVYLYDETNHVIKSEALYANSSSGTITNLIPGQTYYWEKVSDSSVNGLIESTATRRTIDAGNVRNVRDLGGLAISYTDNNVTKTGTLKYGKLYRGAKLSSSNDDVTLLTNLGITREIDLRADSEGSGQARLPVLDNGSGGTDIVIENYLINRTAYTPYSWTHGNSSGTTVQEHSTNATALKNAMKATMQYIIDGDSIYFHCTIGTDRTGTIAYFLEGLLGVSEEDRIEDYELSYYFGLVVDLGARDRYHDDLTTTSIYPRFKFMRTAFNTNQKIYEWFVEGDNAQQKLDDDALIADFRDAMINYNN